MANKFFIPQRIVPSLKEGMTAYRVYDAFLAMKGDKRSWSEIAFNLKNTGDNNLIISSFSNLYKNNPILFNVIWGNVLPNRVEELGTGWNRYFFKPKSLDKEINWVIQVVKKNKDTLENFVLIRDDVEKNILLGNYSKAEEILTKSLQIVGYTVWYYEMRLTIAGLQDDLSKCLELVSDFNSAHKEIKRGIVPIILHTLFSRSLHSVAAYQYDTDLYSRYKKNRTEFLNDRYNYYLFRLNYYQNYNIDDLSVTLIIESLNSVVDRYILLSYVLRSYIIKNKDDKGVVGKYASSLYSLTKDKRWLPYVILQNHQNIPNEYFDYSFISILDNYYTGEYDKVITECKEYVKEKPYNFDVLKLYCRSLLFKNTGYKNISCNDQSVLNEVASLVYAIMTEKDNAKSLDLLYQRCKNLYGLSFASGLDYFIKEEKKWSKDKWLHLSSMTCYDPLFTTAFEEDKDKLSYLDWGSNKDENSVVISYQKRRVERLTTEESKVVPYIREVDNAKITFENADYETSVALWDDIIAINSDYIPTVQTAVEYTFMSYSKMGVKYRQKAIKFYVCKFIENKAFVSKVETKQFMEDIKDSRYQGLKNDIDFLIFIFLNAVNYPQKQFVLQSYCKYEGVTYPSELLRKFQDKDPQKVELFLYLLVTDDLLYHHYKFKSTFEVLDEKIKIASYLKSYVPENKMYSHMCTELMHEIVAYRGMKKLDDSKIFVNEEAIMKYELCKIEDLYDRFKKQADLVRGNRVFVLVSGINFNNNANELIDDITSYSNNAIEEVGLQIFGVIRDAFLKSRFGLGTYLSTRIRHGVFEGELRSDLERLHLILNQSGGTYVDSDYWLMEYSLDSNVQTNLHHALEIFSDNIDKLISKFKDSVIQIHVDEDDTTKGEFDYTVPTKVLGEKLLEIEASTQDLETFCRKVMLYLWEITEERLVIVRNRIAEELKPQIFSHLQILEQRLDALDSYNTLNADQKTAVNDARTALANKLVKIENWFYRQETKFEDFDLESHIHMTMEQASRYYPDVNWSLSKNIERLSGPIRSEYSSSMFDLLFIFFTNMLKYSAIAPQRVFSIDSHILRDGLLEFVISNDIPSDVDANSLNECFMELINDHSRLQQEGRSGLIKAMTIIKYDFGNTNNTFTIEAKDGKSIVTILLNIKDMLVDEKDIDG